MAIPPMTRPDTDDEVWEQPVQAAACENHVKEGCAIQSATLNRFKART